MSFFPDMGCRSFVVAGDYVRAIGWLHPDYAYTTGEVSAEFLTRLKAFVAQCNASAEALYFGACGGFHTCEFAATRTASVISASRAGISYSSPRK